MAPPLIKFEQVHPTKLKFCKPCVRNNHYGPDGRNVCYRSSNVCLACHRMLPPGQFSFQFVGLTEDVVKPEKKPTTSKPSKLKYADRSDEMKQQQIKYSTQWSKNNPDKIKTIQRKYSQKEEVKLRRKEIRDDRWNNTTEEEREEIRRRRREYYVSTKAKRTDEQHQEYLQMRRDRYELTRLENNRKSREKYHAKKDQKNGEE